MTPEPRTRVEDALRRTDRPAVVAYLTGGFPDAEGFETALARVAATADVVEIGVPFSDPMADGVTLQHAAAQALRAGATLPRILEAVARLGSDTPILLMSYLNPLLAHGLDRLVADAIEAGVAGFIVPDLPLEEADRLQGRCDAAGLALVPLVTPLTPPPRLERLVAGARGFVYAVTRTGITGGAVRTDDLVDYLARVRACSPVPVCAGFGIRGPEQVRPIADAVDGVIVGTALVEAVAAGEDPGSLLASLHVPRSLLADPVQSPRRAATSR